MKVDSLNQESVKSLEEQLLKHTSALAELYVSQRTQEVKQNHQFKNHKLAVARIKTALRLKELSNQEATSG